MQALQTRRTNHERPCMVSTVDETSLSNNTRKSYWTWSYNKNCHQPYANYWPWMIRTMTYWPGNQLAAADFSNKATTNRPREICIPCQNGLP